MCLCVLLCLFVRLCFCISLHLCVLYLPLYAPVSHFATLCVQHSATLCVTIFLSLRFCTLLFAGLSVSLFIHMPRLLFVCLSVCMSFCLSVSLCDWENYRAVSFGRKWGNEVLSRNQKCLFVQETFFIFFFNFFSIIAKKTKVQVRSSEISLIPTTYNSYFKPPMLMVHHFS